MADNFTINPDGTTDRAAVPATDQIGGVDYQRIKVGFGADGVYGDVHDGNPLPVSASALPLPTGAATESTLAQVRDAIKAQLDIASTVWTDNSGAYYVRRDVVNEGTGAITVSFTDPSGNAATPGAGLRPLANTDRDVTQALFDATSGGTGYSSGDILGRILVIDANNTPVLTTAIWVNLSTGAVISAPTGGTFERADESIGARQVGTWTVSGPLTDTQLRATAVPVSGPLTEAQIRATALPVSLSGIAFDQGASSASTQRVVLADEQGRDTLITGQATATLNNNAMLAVAGAGAVDAALWRSLYFHIVTSAGVSGGLITFEQSNDLTNWLPLVVTQQTSAIAITAQAGQVTPALTASSQLLFGGAVMLRYVRARISTAITGGTVQVSTRASTLPFAWNTTSMNLRYINSTQLATPVAATGGLPVAQMAPVDQADVSSAARTTTGNNGATGTNNDFGASITGLINVTAASGTTPTLDLVLEEATDSTGTTWFPIWAAPRFLTTGTAVIPNMVMGSGRRRWSWTISGTTPSFTFSINIKAGSANAPVVRSLVDRAIVSTTLGSASAQLGVEGCTGFSLQLVMGAITTTAPVFGIQLSHDGTDWWDSGLSVTGVASSTVGGAIAVPGGARLARLYVKTAGVGSTYTRCVLQGVR